MVRHRAVLLLLLAVFPAAGCAADGPTPAVTSAPTPSATASHAVVAAAPTAVAGPTAPAWACFAREDGADAAAAAPALLMAAAEVDQETVLNAAADLAREATTAKRYGDLLCRSFPINVDQACLASNFLRDLAGRHDEVFAEVGDDDVDHAYEQVKEGLLGVSVGLAIYCQEKKKK